MTSSKSNDLPKVPSPNTVTLGVKASTYEFRSGWWGVMKIQSIIERDFFVHILLYSFDFYKEYLLLSGQKYIFILNAKII